MKARTALRRLGGSLLRTGLDLGLSTGREWGLEEGSTSM